MRLATPNQKRDLELLERIRNGQDEAAKEELVDKYLPMVKHIVQKKYDQRGEFDDLVQEGSISLLKAIDNYNGEQYAIKFSTFAYLCILRRIINIQKYFSTIKHYHTGNPLSLYRSSEDEDSRSLLDLVGDQSADPLEAVLEKLSVKHLKRVLEAYLSPVEYRVFLMYLQGLNCREISESLQLEKKVVDNARTRARYKLQKLVEEYGSLFNRCLPLQARKRMDLAIKVNVG
ncbi:MAG: sigma-70 family RNA polymerase sigma factor [Firmicutes bacterium]|nr:sigma-70 family RNA polymerase sigma factor [Bacillota bacterium]